MVSGSAVGAGMCISTVPFEHTSVYFAKLAAYVRSLRVESETIPGIFNRVFKDAAYTPSYVAPRLSIQHHAGDVRQTSTLGSVVCSHIRLYVLPRMRI